MRTMQTEHTIIVGGGPCGLACAIELQRQHINPLIIEKESLVNTVYQFPTHQTFFSSSDKLEIGGHLFSNEKQKPVRIQALTYYRAVAAREDVRMNTFEKVVQIEKEDNYFQLTTEKQTGEVTTYSAENVIIASGYYDQPNQMGIPGENLPKVTHYFKEGHPYFDQDVVIIGGKNSAVDATLELHKSGARITVLYRGDEYSKSIKPWILPEFDSLVRKNIVTMEFNAKVTEITEDALYYEVNGQTKQVKNDFVFAMTGYQPDLSLLRNAGVQVNENNGKPEFDPNTMETNVPGLYVAGVVASGYNNNEIFIENGRYHGGTIVNDMMNKR